VEKIRYFVEFNMVGKRLQNVWPRRTKCEDPFERRRFSIFELKKLFPPQGNTQRVPLENLQTFFPLKFSKSPKSKVLFSKSFHFSTNLVER